MLASPIGELFRGKSLWWYRTTLLVPILAALLTLMGKELETMCNSSRTGELMLARWGLQQLQRELPIDLGPTGSYLTKGGTRHQALAWYKRQSTRYKPTVEIFQKQSFNSIKKGHLGPQARTRSRARGQASTRPKARLALEPQNIIFKILIKSL